jgi:hypothetical protein
MPRDWEAVCRTWIKASSDTECEKQENAVRMIRDAIDNYEPLARRDIKIIPQGSYRNNTNVRQESDVDICVCCMEPFYFTYEFADYGPAESNVVVGLTYTFAQFKTDVEAALVKKFTRAGVSRGKKAFDVHANTYRVDADVVAAFAHRRYQKKQYQPLFGSYTYPYTEPPGTQFYPDDSLQAIINWPEQHYTNGVAKNLATNYRFKWTVRALKNLKYDMEANGNLEQKQAARQAASYLCECLMYNVPAFAGDSPRDQLRNAIVYAYGPTETDEGCKTWLEVNELKWLFHPTQPWTRAQANNFLLHAWKYGDFS